MDSNSYVAFLVIGTLLVLIDGQIIYRNGRRYLQQATPKASAASLTTLVTVLFHLGTLGVLALLSVIDFSIDDPVRSVVVRLGIVLLVLGVAHWIAVSTIARIRDREEFERINAEREAQRSANLAADAAAVRAQTPHTPPNTYPATDAYIPEQGKNPVYNGESATSVVNRQNQQR